MKTIYWLGGIALIGTALLMTFLASASTGDPVWIRANGPATLTAPQKAAVADAFGATFTGADKTTVQAFYCSRETGANAISCTGDYRLTITEAQYVQLEVKGEATPIETYASPNVTLRRALPLTKASAATKTSWGAFLASVWAGTDIDKVVDWRCDRDQAVPATIRCSMNDIVTTTPAAYVAAKQAGQVIRLVGVVQ